MGKDNATRAVIPTDENDLIVLSDLLPPKSLNHSRITSALKLIRQMYREQNSLLNYDASDQAYSQKLLLIKNLHQELFVLLTENNQSSTWFTLVVDRCCKNDPDLKLRLNHFIQRTIGPIVKLSELVKDKKKFLAIEFPNQEMRDIFLNRSGINEQIESVEIEGNSVNFPAFITKNQQLVTLFPTEKVKNGFIRLLSLDKTKFVTPYSNENKICINDRRIHDTASKFHIAVLCPYFASFYNIKYAALMLHQAYRHSTTFFSPTNFPLELTIKIATEASSSDAISAEEKTQIALSNFRKP